MDSRFERLLDELGTRARAETDQVLATARARATAVAAESTARIEQRRTAAIESCDAEASHARNAALSKARHEGRRALLAAQHAFVDKILDASRGATHRKLGLCANTERLVSRSEELASFSGNGTTEVRCRTPMAQQITSGLGRRGVRVIPDDEAPWGLTLVADNGRLVIEDTVDAWLSSQRAAIAIDGCHRIEEGS
jgi:vacuolar-type H+-ATPase subunit E/Vma4